MSPHRRTLAALALTTIVFLAPAVALADETEDDQDVARELYERGDIASLGDILARQRRDNGGDVVGVDLVRVGDRWVYRLQVVAADGHRSIIDVDAGSALVAAPGGDD